MSVRHDDSLDGCRVEFRLAQARLNESLGIHRGAMVYEEARQWTTKIFVTNSFLNQVGLTGCDHFLIPLDAYARHLWDVNLSAADFAVPLQNRVAPIQPFQ
jgi:hypothetical protein